MYEQRESRLSYVIWQEGVALFIAIELLSPSTEKEDLGEVTPKANQPPTKWEVYEKILRIPYYVVFNGNSNKLRLFELVRNNYREVIHLACQILASRNRTRFRIVVGRISRFKPTLVALV